MKGKKYKELAQLSGISGQAMRNKFARGSFSEDELIMVADFVGCQLAFEIDDAQKAFLTKDDLRKPATKQPIMQNVPEPEPAAMPKTTPKKHYKPFTDTDAAKIDLQELLANIRYQLDIATVYGNDILSALLSKAR